MRYQKSAANPIDVSTKLLFLDFDGVLHSGNANSEQRFARAPALEEALGTHRCGIVISSSWRFHHSFDALELLLPASLRARLEGRTGNPVIGRHARYQEIRAWLSGSGGRDWRALDDSTFEFPEICPRLIACNGATGLGVKQVEAIKAWLASPVCIDENIK